MPRGGARGGARRRRASSYPARRQPPADGRGPARSARDDVHLAERDGRHSDVVVTVRVAAATVGASSTAPSRHAWDGDNDGGGGSSPPPLRRRQTRRRGASSCRSLPWPSRPHALQPHVRQERVEPATGGLSAQTDGRAHACFRAGKRSVLQKPRMRVLHGPSFLFFYAR